MRKLLAVLMLALVACSDSAGPRPADLTGNWRGELVTQTSTSIVTVTLTHNRQTRVVTGNGFLMTAGQSLALAATGTFVEPTLSLTLAATGFQAINFTGILTSPGIITGTVNGSGFTQIPFGMTRQ